VRVQFAIHDFLQLRLNQRKRARQLQVDQHLNAPVELIKQRRALGR